MKQFTQEKAHQMYDMLARINKLFASEVFTHADGTPVPSNGISELLAEIDSERKVSERQITSTHLTTAEYAAIHAINKQFKGFK